MTNSSKKTTNATRDNFDLDLDARLDQATSGLRLNDEPPAGDTLDQILAQAKKEIDVDLSEKLPPDEISELDVLNVVKNEKVDSNEIKSESLTSLENQLAAAMDSTSTLENDAELDSLLGGSGFDFDSLLGEAASDELAIIPEIEDDLLMSAVDELLQLGVSEEDIEPEMVLDESEEILEEKIIEPEEENKLESDVELTVEPDAALDDLVDSVPFEDTLNVDSIESEIEDFTEEFNNFDEVADSVAPLVEISTSDESFKDDLNVMQQLDGLNEAMENKNDTTAGFDLLDDDAVEKASETPVVEVADDDWMKQLEGLDDIEPSESVSLKKEAVVADDDDWMKQLDGLDDIEPSESVSLEKEAVVADDDDWMKQLEGLEDIEPSESVSLEKEAVIADDDDWMKQLDGGLDEHDEDTAKMLMDAVHNDSDDGVVADSNFNITHEEPAAVKVEKNEIRGIDEEALIAKAADLAISQFKDEFKDDQEHIMSQLRADQDTIESRNKKQFVDTENKRKKTAIFGYVALGVGVIGLLGSAGIGWLSYGTKGQTETLGQSVTALEEKVDAFLAKNPEKEIETIKISVEQLNQKVEKLAAAQVAVPVPSVAITPVENGKTSPTVELAKTNSPVALLNNKVEPALPEMAVIKPTVSTDEKIIDAPKTIAAPESVKKSADSAKTDAAKLAKIETEKTAKAEALLLSEKIAKATAVAKAAAASTKTDEQRKLLAEKATRYTGRMTRGMARGAAKEHVETTKTKVAVKTTNKEVLNTKITPQKSVSAGKYSVNVVSYQQEWFAQSKAAEFKQKGIPVEVVPVEANNVGTRYRLKVAGFKNKSEANAYAEKIKKSHNLGESWVGEN